MNKPARNALFLFGGEGASRLLGFLTAAVLARRVGVDGFGQIGFATAILAYGMVITDFGLVSLGTREMARDKSRAQQLAGSVLSLRLALAVSAAILMVAFAAVLPKPASVKWLLSAYALAAVAQSVLLEWVFIGAEQTAWVSFSRVATNLSYFVLVLQLVRSPRQILLVPVSFAVAMVAGVLMLLVVFARHWHRPTLNFDLREWRRLLTSAWPIGMGTVVSQLHVNFGMVGLGLLTTDIQTGIYAAAYRLVFFFMTLDRIFYTVFLPAATRYVAQQRERLATLTGTATRLVLAVALPLCLGLAILAQPAVTLVFGRSYASAAPALRVLVWFLLLSMLNSLTGYTLIAAGLERRFLRNITIGATFSLVLNVAGILTMGALGAAGATVIGEGIILFFMAADFLKLVRPQLGISTLVPVMATGVMAAVCLLLLRFGVALSVSAAAVVYVALLLGMRGVTAGDLGLVRSR